jgi:hypothetical protein
MSEMKYNTKPSEVRMAKLLKILETPSTYTEIEKQFFISNKWMKGYIKHLRKIKLVYIDSWIKEQKEIKEVYVPIFCIGNYSDAARPAPLSSKERAQIARNRLNQDLDKKDLFLAKRRAKLQPIKADWTSSWIKPRSPALENTQDLYPHQ